MSGLLRRLTRRRPATADETGTATPESSEPAGAPADTPDESGGGSPVPAPAEEQATQVLPATGEQPAQPVEQPTVVEAAQPTQAIQPPAPVRDLPAGIDPNELADAPVASARRGKLRRRLRYLRAVRDLLLRDLGGFAYEIQRSAGGIAQETHKRLIEAKTNRLAALDSEVRGLESRLGEPHSGALLREPGIGGTCPECGEIHASDAHYCARCGAPLDAKARARRDAAVAAAAHQTTSSHPATPEPAPASVLWAAGPRPEHKPESEEDEDTHPSFATSQWLALRPHAPAEQAPAAKGEEPAATEPAAKADAPVATAGEAAAKAAEPAKADEPAAQADEPAKADEPAATTDDPGAEEAPLSERTATWLGAIKPPDDAEKADPPAPQTVAAKRGGTRARATGESAEKATDDAGDKPKRPRGTRAKKPAPPESAEAASGEEAPAKPKRTRAKKPSPGPEFAPEPNGRRDDPVTPPHGDALTSRPEQGS